MRGLTQREAAQAAGVDANTIWRYEAGRARPSDLALRGLAVIYGTAVDWLLSDEDGDVRTGERTLVDAELAKAQNTVYANSVLLLSRLGQDLSDESLRSISDFTRYLHERETCERSKG